MLIVACSGAGEVSVKPASSWLHLQNKNKTYISMFCWSWLPVCKNITKRLQLGVLLLKGPALAGVKNKTVKQQKVRQLVLVVVVVVVV